MKTIDQIRLEVAEQVEVFKDSAFERNRFVDAMVVEKGESYAIGYLQSLYAQNCEGTLQKRPLGISERQKEQMLEWEKKNA